MNIDKEMKELFELLDKNSDIIKLKEINNKITKKELDLINNYRDNPSIENKKMLYDNKIIREYLQSENNINYLIMEINSKFKRSKSCEGNKW